MARIRSIKPEFWTSEQVMECSPNARLLFLGMWNFADDCGRLPCSPKSLKAQIFPGDDISFDSVRGMINELSSNGLVLIYAIEDKEYLQVTGWHHQRIDKPQPAKYPAPFFDNSKNAPRTLPPDRIGKEGIGKEGNQECAVAPSLLQVMATTQPILAEGVKLETDEAQYFRRAREIVGSKGGGIAKQLLIAKGSDYRLARSALELASSKGDPTTYLRGIINASSKPKSESDPNFMPGWGPAR